MGVNRMPKKLLLDSDEETWAEVQKYRIDQKLRNNNEAVIKLIRKALGLNENNATKARSGKQ